MFSALLKKYMPPRALLGKLDVLVTIWPSVEDVGDKFITLGPPEPQLQRKMAKTDHLRCDFLPLGDGYFGGRFRFDHALIRL